jgi:hypothetical protein
MVQIWISFWMAMSDVSIQYSGVCFLERNYGSTSRAQWQCVSKSVAFFTIAVQGALGNWQTVVLVLSCELFWSSSCKNFMIPKLVLDDPISRTMTVVQMMCHFVYSHPSIIHNMARTRSIFSSAVDVDELPERASSVTLVPPFLYMVIHSCTLRWGKTLFSYCAESLRWRSAPGTPSAYMYHCTAALLWCVQKSQRPY